MALMLRMAVWAMIITGMVGVQTAASAQARAPLAVVRPVQSCSALAQAPLAQAAGAPVRVQASLLNTPKGQFCHVTGTIAPAIGFEVDLPTTKWTQRFIQVGCGGLCGMINASIGNAGGCQPALNGEFVLAASDLGHQGKMGSPTEGDFAEDPQKRIDFAYRANHLTALVSKALIRAYYGQAQRYSYFSGCSDGGREAMMEAERFPDDFDGISAGAPAMLFQVQNSFWHAWTVAANTGADGRRILLADKLPILHAAVLAHCDELDGVKDNLLTDPRACHVDPAWVLCTPHATDTARCLTPAEWAVAAKIYSGPVDAEGRHFLPGGAQPGSETRWNFAPADASATVGGARMIASMSKVVLMNPTAADQDAVHYPFTTAQFARVSELHSLNDATDIDLRPFAAHGGKLLMYHGWSDDSIAPMISVAYYRAVQQWLGVSATDRFMRLFMIPGMGHCGGGDGFSQFDTLSAVMSWVETGAAPGALLANQIPEQGIPGAAPLSGRGGPDGRGGLPGMHSSMPYAREDLPALASRPIYPFPMIAHIEGRSDPKVASSYHPAPSPAAEPATVPWYGAGLLVPGGEKDYVVRDGKLVVAGS